MSKLVLIRGLPGSGKSTMAKKIMDMNPDKEYIHYENDMFLYENGQYVWTPRKFKVARNLCYIGTVDALNRGMNVIVTNCFLTKKSLNRYAKLVHEMDLTIIEAKGNYTSIHNVPEKMINKMREIYEPI